MSIYPADDERFQRDEVGRPFLDAVQALCEQTGQTLAHMEFLSHHQIADLAVQTYGDSLPAFWKVWLDWQRPQGPQPMGDLNDPS
ncbi:MAG: hypothetical protein ACKOBW_10245 [Planctomycetota bacterium]